MHNENKWILNDHSCFYAPAFHRIFFEVLILKVRKIQNDFSSQCFFKKTNKKIRLYYLLTCFLFIFWKKVKTPRRHFEINWPLASESTKKYGGHGFQRFSPQMQWLKSKKKKLWEQFMICLLTSTANPVLIQKIEPGWLSWLADKSQTAPNVLIFGSKTIYLRWKMLTHMPLPCPYLFFGLHLVRILGTY